MIVKIGKYISWWGPYQIANLLRYVGVSKDKCHSIGEKLADTKLADLCEWIHSKRTRTVKIKIHNYDTWNLDDTLSMIILPLLFEFRKNKSGYPMVADEYVPEALQSKNARPKVNEYDPDNLAPARWDYVLEEIMYAFRYTNIENMHMERFDSFDSNTRIELEKRVQNGFKLFGIFYRAMWD